eukprot:COSAG04_NODE_1696_length_5900_cov_86.704706_5_plen_89_part_00
MAAQHITQLKSQMRLSSQGEAKPEGCGMRACLGDSIVLALLRRGQQILQRRALLTRRTQRTLSENVLKYGQNMAKIYAKTCQNMSNCP